MSEQTTPKADHLVQFGDIPVEQRKHGEKRVWHYLGSDLNEYLRMGRICMSNLWNYFDMVTQEPYGPAYRRTMSEKVAKLALGFEHLRRDGQTELEFPEEFPKVDPEQARGFTSDYNCLVQFGVLERAVRDGKSYYSLTEFGQRFANNQVPSDKRIILHNRNVLKRDGRTFLSQVITEDLPHRWWEKDAQSNV